MKQVFNKGSDAPLSYPINDEKLLEIEKTPSKLVNPMIGKSHGLPMPTYPRNVDGSVNETFLEELFEVVHVRLLVSRGIYPAEFMAKHHPRKDFDPMRLPEPLWGAGLSIDNPKGLANIVHMDLPVDMPHYVLRWVNSLGVPLKQPETNCIDFLGKVPNMIDAISMATDEALTRAFESKYWFGRPRPEEAIGIVGGDFTAYPEGCPNHPAYPAGHSAATAGVLPILQHYDLEKSQINEIFDTAYHWGMYRTFAGVHYATDNLAGLVVAGLMEYGCKGFVQSV